MCYYRPSPAQAYQDMKDLQFVVFLGPFLRAMHRWAAHGMVICVVSAHVPRFLHRLLQKAAPVQLGGRRSAAAIDAGPVVHRVLAALGSARLSGPSPSAPTSAAMRPSSEDRFVSCFSAAMAWAKARCFASTCFMWRCCPSLHHPLHDRALLACSQGWRSLSAGLETEIEGARCAASHHRRTRWRRAAQNGHGFPNKTYGLMEVVTGKPIFETIEPEEEQDAVFSYPYAFFREAIALMVTVTGIMAISLLFHAPLEELANPARTPNPAKAPWYFLGLQELVSHSALLGGVVAPTLMVLALLAIPYFDRNPSRLPSDRRWALWLFTAFVAVNLVLIVVGTFFRGPGWAFVPPWVHVVSGAE